MNMKIEKYIKTQCGLERYHQLYKEKDKSIYHQLRLYLYVLTASIRDFLK